MQFKTLIKEWLENFRQKEKQRGKEEEQQRNGAQTNMRRNKENVILNVKHLVRMFLLTILAAGPVEPCETVTKLRGPLPTVAPVEAHTVATHRCRERQKENSV